MAGAAAPLAAEAWGRTQRFDSALWALLSRYRALRSGLAQRPSDTYLDETVYTTLRKRIERLAAITGEPALGQGLRGIEKESLRVRPDGRIAQTPHPTALGASLTHPWITTDFAEAMVELITPPLGTNQEALAFLRELHRYVYDKIGDELLWPASMPCFLEDEESVQIARFGSSNSGRMREVYRRGLSLRYGRAMQAISGVHFNFSPPEAFWPALQEIDDAPGDGRPFRDAALFGLMRNYRRHGWLILYLFGASPAVCHTFFLGRATDLPELLPGTFHRPYATSLRMSDLGYRNRRQAGLRPSMNALDAYLADLDRAVSTLEPAYEAIGLERGGERVQLSTNLLQIENEFYGFIRPKQPVAFGERPITALFERGVAYIEVRALDVNPFEPLGVGGEQVRFLEAFLWFCLLSDSPPMDGDALVCCDADHTRVASEGRRPGLELPSLGRSRPLVEWAREILAEMKPIAELLDRARGLDTYTSALSAQREKIEAPERTPSARMIEEILARQSSFFETALDLSRRHRDALFAGPPLGLEARARLDEAVAKSLVAQAELERTQTDTLDDYIRGYLAGGRDCRRLS